MYHVNPLLFYFFTTELSIFHLQKSEVEVTTTYPQDDIVQQDEVDAVTTVRTVYSDTEEQVVQDEPESTGSPVTDRSRQDVDDEDEDDSDEDDDVTTVAPVEPVSQPAGVVPTRYNESNVQNEFYIASQVLGSGFNVESKNATVAEPVVVKAATAAVEDSEDSEGKEGDNDDDEEEEAEGDDDEEEEAIADIIQSKPIAPEDQEVIAVVAEQVVQPVAIVDAVTVVKSAPAEEDVRNNEIIEQQDEVVPAVVVQEPVVEENVTSAPESNVVYEGQARAACGKNYPC